MRLTLGTARRAYANFRQFSTPCHFFSWTASLSTAPAQRFATQTVRQFGIKDIKRNMKRIESLTFLRFIAALIVVVFHFGRNTSLAKSASPFITSGPQMVSLFFVISGFVMMVAHYEKNDETFTSYYIKRVARIVPIYLIALSLATYSFYNNSSKNNSIALFLALTFLQSWFPPYPLSLNGPAWSLSVEAFFYLTFPFILFGIKKSNISWKKIAILSFLLYCFTQVFLSNLLSNGFYSGFPSPSHDLIYYFPLSHYCSFLLGVSGGFIYVENTNWFNKKGFLPFTVLILVFSLNYLALQRPDVISRLIGYPLAFGSSFYSLLFIFLILSLAYSGSAITRIMSTPFLVLLGESSYSLYILQKPVQHIYTKYILKYLAVNNPDEEFYILVFLLICISVASYHFVEKPGKRLILVLYEFIRKWRNEKNHSTI